MVNTSKPEKDSSKRSTFGFPNRAKAITNFFFWPPDKNFALMSLMLSNSNLDINSFIL